MYNGHMRRKLVVFGFLAVIIIVGLLAVSTVIKNNAPYRKTANQFVEYALVGNTSQSYALCSTAAQKNQSYSDWQSTVTLLDGFFKNNADYSSSVSSASKATVDYLIKGADNKSYTFVVNLAKDGSNGAWQVSSFDSQLTQTSSTTAQTQSSTTTGSD
jgi:hypothetical protein